MAAVSEHRPKRSRRARQVNGRRSTVKRCAVCGTTTKWLSVDGLCWDCTIKAARNKTPIYIEMQEEEAESSETATGSSND